MLEMTRIKNRTDREVLEESTKMTRTNQKCTFAGEKGPMFFALL